MTRKELINDPLVQELMKDYSTFEKVENNLHNTSRIELFNKFKQQEEKFIIKDCNGNSLYIGDHFCVVDLTTYTFTTEHIVDSLTFSQIGSDYYKRYRVFKEKKDAEEWIVFNAKVLTVQDIINLDLSNCYMGNNGNGINKIISFVKFKIKKGL